MQRGTRRVRLGDLLLEHHIITEQQLHLAVEEQKKVGVKLGRILIDQGVISEDVLMQFLAKQLNIPFYDLRQYSAVPVLVKKLSEAYARRFRAIVLEDQGDHYLVGVSDPFDITVTDEVQRALDKPMRLAIVREADLLRTLDLVYRRTDEITAFAEALDDSIEDTTEIMDLDYQAGEADAPVIKLLRSVFEDAVQIGASDIHIEPDENLLRIRLRVDGFLQEQIVKEHTIARAIVARLKLMAKLNIAERRLPQDGRFNTRIRQHTLDVRLSTMPTQYGESAVMRLLDQSGGVLRLESVGMTGEVLTAFRKSLTSPHGVILVTGPTGSGKTTTLNAGLQELNTAERKIITVEDPVEYRLHRVNQVHVNPKVGLDFATVLRAALRQDPDIILVGEMRDTETATVAIRAALTGHLVLSSLHTNDSASSALRLLDMGVDGFLVASTLRGILAQRLIRRICQNCKMLDTPGPLELTWLKGMGVDPTTVTFKKGAGCSTCNRSGYRGRVGIFEFLDLTEPMLEALRTHQPDRFLEIANQHLKGRLLVDNALQLARQGMTTIGEAMRIGGDR